MRILKSAAVVAIVWGVSAGAATQPADSGRILACALVDLTTDSTVDYREAQVEPAPKDPILFLFGSGELMGTVRDIPGASPGERKLDLALTDSAGSESGNARGGTVYRVDQPITQKPLAEVSLDVSDSGSGFAMGFETTMSLRCFLTEANAQRPAMKALTARVAEVAPSTTTEEMGSGNAYGVCSGSDGPYCLEELKRRARQDALNQAGMSCEDEGGTADTFTASCIDTCNPFDLPPYAPIENVTCNSNCTVRCEIPTRS